MNLPFAVAFRTFALVCAALCALFPSDVQSRPRFRAIRIKDADTLFAPGSASLTSFPRLNERNQVLFLNMFRNGHFTSGVWQNGHVQLLGGEAGYTRVTGRGMNDNGEVVGEAEFTSGTVHVHGFATSQQQISTLPINPEAHLFGGCLQAIAFDMNDQGVASGWTSYALALGFGYYRPVIWQGGNLIEAGILGAYQPDSQNFRWPVYINNSGNIAGTAQVFVGGQVGQRGYYGPPGSLQEITPLPNGRWLYVWDLNEVGTMVGESEGDSAGVKFNNHAVLIEGNQKKDIHGKVFGATINSKAYAVNDSGAAVGWWEGGTGLYYDNDTTWRLSTLLASPNFVGDGGLVTLYEGIDINNQGIVLALYAGPFGASYPCLLVPVDSGLYVNTTNDLPDLDPGDGKCYTGNVTTFGEDECSLRAALQHSNLTPALDTIKFRIREGQPGAPVIRPNSSGLGPLPTVAEPVVIDGRTQPAAHRVALDGSLLPIVGHGLRVEAFGSQVLGLAIYGFPLNGIQINVDSTTIQDCWVGIDASGVLHGNHDNGIELNLASRCQIGDSAVGLGNRIEGNYAHGIRLKGDSCKVQGNVIRQNGYSPDSLLATGAGVRIEGNGNLIGGESEAIGNMIARNKTSGVNVISGVGNAIRSNSLDSNLELGIELSPGGVTQNDALDLDFGSNQLQNFPEIDSVLYVPGPPRLFGHLVSEPDQLYDIQIFKSADCDPSGYGEGRDLVYSARVSAGASGVAAIGPWVILEAEDNAYLTATATDLTGNTSEFSPCFGVPRLVMLDVDSIPIPNQLFDLSTVAHDAPLLTETFLDTATTDFAGQIFLRDVGLLSGDQVKVVKHLHTEPRSKPATHFGAKYSIRLDNLQFDAFGNNPEYYRVNDSLFQHVLMNHTSVAYNLVVAVEWDAEVGYLQSMETNLRQMANYYYDVSDGQLVFDTIAVVDDGAYWDEADVWVHASNALWPHVTAVGGLHSATTEPSPVQMPREFFGDEDKNRNLSYSQHPLDLLGTNDFRTKAHELGHYMLSFSDEYVFGFHGYGSRCDSMKLYGYMDSQFDSTQDLSSEMSSAAQYANSDCRNTRQWRENGQSCWDTWEAALEGSHMGIKVPVIKPEERDLPPGRVYVSGPNALRGALDYDVGRHIVFPVTPSAPAVAQSRLFQTVLATNGSPLSGASVVSFGQTSGMEQGLTSDSGFIWILGFKPGNGLLFNHWVGAFASGYFVPGSSLLAAVAETTVVQLKVAAGDPRMIQTLTVGGGTAAIAQAFNVNLPGVPTLTRYQSQSVDGPYAFSGGGSSVTVNFSDSSGFSGLLVESAPNAVSDTFYFVSEFNYTKHLAQNDWTSIADPSGATLASRDSLFTPIQQAGILSTHFPVRRDGLDTAAEQAGPVASFACDPNLASGDGCGITIRYGDSELSGQGGFGFESSLRIFRWNESTDAWVLVGGQVDGSHNEVSAPISQGGVYAAFTTDQTTGTDDSPQGALLPRGYNLAQNHPNPFNPSTIIAYSLPQPGRVSLRIHNILGQTVRILVDELRQAGNHEVVWDGRNANGDEAGSGVYFYQLRVDGQVFTRRMVLVK